MIFDDPLDDPFSGIASPAADLKKYRTAATIAPNYVLKSGSTTTDAFRGKINKIADAVESGATSLTNMGLNAAGQAESEALRAQKTSQNVIGDASESAAVAESYAGPTTSQRRKRSSINSGITATLSSLASDPFS
jgi:hypothetical protein